MNKIEYVIRMIAVMDVSMQEEKREQLVERKINEGR